MDTNKKKSVEKQSQDFKIKTKANSGVPLSQKEGMETAAEVGSFLMFLMPLFKAISAGVSKLPLLALIISESALIPLYIIIAVVSFILSLLPIPILGPVPFLIFTILEIVLAVICGILCVTSLLKAITVFQENKRDSENYKKSNTFLSVVLIVLSAIYTILLPIFMVLNVVDLVLSIF